MRLSATSDSSIPAGFRFTGSYERLGVSYDAALRILEKAGIPLDSGNTVSFPAETMQLLQKKTERTEEPTKTKKSA